MKYHIIFGKICVIVLFWNIGLHAQTYENAAQTLTYRNSYVEICLSIPHTYYHYGDTLKAQFSVTCLNDSAILVQNPEINILNFSMSGTKASGIEMDVYIGDMFVGSGYDEYHSRYDLLEISKNQEITYSGTIIITPDQFHSDISDYRIFGTYNFTPWVDKLNFLYHDSKLKGALTNEQISPMIMATTTAELGGLEFYVSTR